MIPMGTFFATGVGFTGTIWTETVKAKASLTPIDCHPGYFTLWLDGSRHARRYSPLNNKREKRAIFYIFINPCNSITITN